MVLPGEGYLERHMPLAWLRKGEGGRINAIAGWRGLDVRDRWGGALVEEIGQRPVTPRFQRRQVRDVRGEWRRRMHHEQTMFEKNFALVTPHRDLGRLPVGLLGLGGRGGRLSGSAQTQAVAGGHEERPDAEPEAEVHHAESESVHNLSF